SWFGGVGAVPLVMTAASALAGAAIPAAALVTFRRELSDGIRLLVAAIVTCAPVLWMSAQYGNTAVVSTAAVAMGLATLSNRPQAAGTALGLTLCAAGVLFRADAVLMAPVVAWLVIRNAGSLRAALLPLGLGALAFGLVWGGLRLFDPWMSAESVQDVAAHFGDDTIISLFWEHGLWAFSPLVLIFALFGAEKLVTDRRDLGWAIALWALPVFVFYFGATTTPRYFLLAVVPVSIAVALGMERIAGAVKRPMLGWAVVLALGFVHLWVGLGHFTSGNWATVFMSPAYGTHDGPMPTGALVYQGYARGDGILQGSINRGGPWGSRAAVPRAADPQLARVRDGAGAERPGRIFVLLDDWNGHVFQFHALKAGATITGRDPGWEHMAPTHFDLNGVPLTAVGIPDDEFAKLDRVDLAPGDEVWHIVPASPFPRAELEAKLPASVDIVGPVDGEGSALEVYRIVEAGS
ncbi:MAG: hypothetical protein RLN75_05465, partial [Longimicrobiales bacterium]